MLDTLKNTSEFLAGVRGRRKAVVFFSEGIDYPITDLFGSQNATDVIRATRDAVTMAARANVNYFTVDPRGLVGMTSEFMEMQGSGAPELAGGPAMAAAGTNAPITSITGAAGGPFNAHTELMHELQLSQNSLRTLAEETGGIAAVNSNSLTSAFERIVEANSRYYVLGYYPPTHPRDGRFHKIEVRVKRPGARVQARRGYASPRGRTVEERKRDEEARRAREARRPDADKTSTQLERCAFQPDATERSDVHRAGRRRSRTPRRRRRSPSRSSSMANACSLRRRTRKDSSPTRLSSRFSASTRTGRRSPAHGRSST